MKTYKPGLVADADMRRELTAIEQAAQRADPHAELQYLHAAPGRIRKGMRVLADGSDWNPGSGPGPYVRNEANTAWVFEGVYTSGGTVTQLTSKATGVTLNKPCGEITMDAAALAAATVVSFTMTNSVLAAGDVLVLNHVSGGTLGVYGLNAACASGSAVVYVRNNTAGSLSEAIVIRFAAVKGATS